MPPTPGADKPGFGLPELLAPAGDWDCVRAAVENGADAVYFGLERFNARMRAQNFTAADLPELLGFLHRRGVRAYVTFNTLVFENELAEAEEFVRTIIAAGVDAAIVQDVGICTLIRRVSPDFPIHASTQMTITSAAGVEFARELGCNLVVLARECSLKEIEKIQTAQLARLSNASSLHEGGVPDNQISGQLWQPIPLEVFVHGALCVAYSGQCLTSEALGGRSANRGECAQACRLPYELIADGLSVDLGDRKYLLSPQDLAGVKVLPDLVRLGVASLKIEGRLKSPEYVANITRIYRTALDNLSRRVSPAGKPTGVAQHFGLDDAQDYEMQMAFSRGLHTGWFQGTNNQALVHARFGKKRGVYLGQVACVERGRIGLELLGPLKAGDGVVFDAGHPEEPEQGGRVYAIEQRGSENWLSFGHGDIDFRKVNPGDRLWKTSDPELDRRLRQSFESPRFQRPISMEVHGHACQALSLIVQDESGHVVRRDSAVPLAVAHNQPLTTERLRQQLGRLGGTPFRLGLLVNKLEGEVMLPVSEINRLRRDAVAQLETLRARAKRWTLHPQIAGAEDHAPVTTGLPSSENAGPLVLARTIAESPAAGLKHLERGKPELIVLVRNLAQLETALKQEIRLFYCDFEDPKKYRDAVAVFRSSGRHDPQAALFVAPPRILKMGEEWTLKQVRSCEADGYLIRNYDHLNYFAADRRVGDFSLNIANRFSAGYFKKGFGLERVTASYDLNFVQLESLLRATPPEWFEVTIHQHMPLFHMEHCVFCAFLSQGTDYTNCGRPCDKHDLKLRDRTGAEHPVKADIGCRNTVFNALAQTGAEHVARLLNLGVRYFRVEFLNESPVQVELTISKYLQLLRGDITGPQVWRELKLLNQLGVTRGQLAS